MQFQNVRAPRNIWYRFLLCGIHFLGTFKMKKINLAKENFNPNLIKDKLFYLKSGRYLPLNSSVYEQIMEGLISFWTLYKDRDRACSHFLFLMDLVCTIFDVILIYMNGLVSICCQIIFPLPHFVTWLWFLRFPSS